VMSSALGIPTPDNALSRRRWVCHCAGMPLRVKAAVGGGLTL
jgi:hypothetical protein